MSVETKNIVRAAARLTWTGAAITFPGRSPGFSAVLRTGAGIYTLTLDRAIDVNNVTISITVLSATDTFAFVNPLNAGNFTVNIVDAGNNAVDASFTVIVHEVPSMA